MNLPKYWVAFKVRQVRQSVCILLLFLNLSVPNVVQFEVRQRFGKALKVRHFFGDADSIHVAFTFFRSNEGGSASIRQLKSLRYESSGQHS